jgi:hypothetical protein
MTKPQQVRTKHPKSGQLADIEIHRDTPFAKKESERIELDMSRICAGTTTGNYDGRELRPFDGRPGAMTAYNLPSRGF